MAKLGCGLLSLCALKLRSKVWWLQCSQSGFGFMDSWIHRLFLDSIRPGKRHMQAASIQGVPMNEAKRIVNPTLPNFIKRLRDCSPLRRLTKKWNSPGDGGNAGHTHVKSGEHSLTKGASSTPEHLSEHIKNYRHHPFTPFLYRSQLW